MPDTGNNAVGPMIARGIGTAFLVGLLIALISASFFPLLVAVLAVVVLSWAGQSMESSQSGRTHRTNRQNRQNRQNRHNQSRR
jgi:hypothetical protein